MISLFIAKVVLVFLSFGLLSKASPGFSFSIVSLSFSDSLVSYKAMIIIFLSLINVIRFLYFDFLLAYYLPLMFRKAISVKLNYYYTVYYFSLIYELCLDKYACFFVLTATSQNLSVSLKISFFYQTIYQYLLDNSVSGLSFVPTIIAALHSFNRL